MQGCLIAIFLLVSALIVGVITNAIGVQDNFFMVIVVWGIVGTIMWRFLSNAVKAQLKTDAEEKQKKTDQLTQFLSETTNEEFAPSHQFIIKNNTGFIQIDEEELKIRIGGISPDTQALSAKIINIDRVLNVQVAVNGKGVMGSDLSNTLGIAAVGGLLFGGAGAIVGAIAGQNAKTKTISEVSLVLAIDDLSTPFISLNFITAVTNIGSEEHTTALSEAQKWLGMINIMLARRDKSSYAS
jgi:hypothetical protein